MRRMMIGLVAVCAMAASAPAQTATWMNLTGTQASAFKIGPPASALTMTNSSGVLSLSGGLTANGVVTLGTSVGAFTTTGVITSTYNSGAPLVIASVTKVSNLNVDYVDGISMFSSGSTGGVIYENGAGSWRNGLGGTNGQFLKLDTGVPTWVGLSSANIWVGNGSNLPTAVAPSGDVTINSSGVTAIGSGKVTSAMILDGTIASADLNSSSVASTHIVNDSIVAADINVTSVGYYIAGAPTQVIGVESGNTIRVTITLKALDGSTNLGVQTMVPVNLSGTQNDMDAVTGATVTTTFIEGTVFTTITSNKKYLAMSSTTNGKLIIDVNTSGAATIYLNYVVGTATYAATLVFA